MSDTPPAPGSGARNRRDKAEETTRTALALIDAEREAARKKTNRLREMRVAQEKADAKAEAATEKPKAKRRSPAKKAAS